jgi:hypothetical protein
MLHLGLKMYNILYNYDNRFFALCHPCNWAATIFAKIENYECPYCPGKDVELIPLNSDEKYEYLLESDKGLEIRFSKL